IGSSDTSPKRRRLKAKPRSKARWGAIKKKFITNRDKEIAHVEIYIHQNPIKHSPKLFLRNPLVPKKPGAHPERRLPAGSPGSVARLLQAWLGDPESGSAGRFDRIP